MSEWTPGPWTLDGGAFPFYVEADLGGLVATVDDAANARLIAAAPEMAALLAEWRDAVDADYTDAIMRRDALLARIRGES